MCVCVCCIVYIYCSECESGLGISVVNQVMKLLTRADPEEAEVLVYVATVYI